MQAKAVAKYIRISPRKMKPIANLVRGKKIKEARLVIGTVNPTADPDKTITEISNSLNEDVIDHIKYLFRKPYLRLVIIGILKFTPNKGADIFLKVLNSAIANAENNHDMDVENLYITEIYANQGPTMKRWKAGSMGRANPIKRRSSHVGVVVSEKE